MQQQQDNNNINNINTSSTINNNRKTGQHTTLPSIWLPPGFRFHPTDNELITFYLVKKVVNSKFCAHAISEVDLNKYEPWDLPEKANMGEKEWYFFSLRDRKYPTGMRTNRATEAGYWKATGKDRDVRGFTSNTGHNSLVGMKKTLVFYKGRAPRGEKTNWVMHEYRLEGKTAYLYGSRTSKEEWVVCRIFQKRVLAAKLKLSTPGDEDGHDSDIPSSPATVTNNGEQHFHHQACKQEHFDLKPSSSKPMSSELLGYNHNHLHDNNNNSTDHHLSCFSSDHTKDPTLNPWNPRSFSSIYSSNTTELARLLDPEFLPALNNHCPRSSSLAFKPGLSGKASCKSEPTHQALLAGDPSLSYSKVMEASLGLLGESFILENQQAGGNSLAPDQGLLNELLFSRFLSDPASSSSEFDQLYAF